MSFISILIGYCLLGAITTAIHIYHDIKKHLSESGFYKLTLDQLIAAVIVVVIWPFFFLILLVDKLSDIEVLTIRANQNSKDYGTQTTKTGKEKK